MKNKLITTVLVLLAMPLIWFASHELALTYTEYLHDQPMTDFYIENRTGPLRTMYAEARALAFCWCSVMIGLIANVWR